MKGEEGRTAKGITAPQKVSQQEREDHNRAHTPALAEFVFAAAGHACLTNVLVEFVSVSSSLFSHENDSLPLSIPLASPSAR